MSTRGRVCIAADYLYPVLVPTTMPFAGGAETQLVKMAHGLVARDFEVSVACCNYGQPEEVVIRGLRVLSTFRPDLGWPVVRFFHPRTTGRLRAFRRAEAEVYYVNAAGLVAGVSGEYARWAGAGYINHCASDYDVTRRGIAQYQSLRDRAWYLRSLRHADARLVQTEWQGGQLRDEFGLTSEVLPNLVVIPALAADVTRGGPVVWVGTYKEIKRPEWFLRLAADCPDTKFVMAGVIPPPPLTRNYFEIACVAARRLTNLEVRGFQSDREIAELFHRASLLVHTSPVEGFSNVILEAWATGLPTVSCVNPDEIVTREGLGLVVETYDEILAEVRRLIANPAKRRELGARARAYATTRHAPDAVIDRLAAILDRVVADVRARRAR